MHSFHSRPRTYIQTKRKHRKPSMLGSSTPPVPTVRSKRRSTEPLSALMRGDPNVSTMAQRFQKNSLNPPPTVAQALEPMRSSVSPVLLAVLLGFFWSLYLMSLYSLEGSGRSLAVSYNLDRKALTERYCVSFVLWNPPCVFLSLSLCVCVSVCVWYETPIPCA